MVIKELITKLGFNVDNTKLGAFDKKLEGLKSSLASGASKFGAFGESAASALSALSPTTIAIGAATMALAGIVKGLAAATQKYLAFEQGMKGVERVTLATAEEMGRMEEAALEAGEASIFTTADSANAMKFLAQAGLDVDQVITALPGALQLAAAAEMDLATAADISTNILTSNGLKVEELTRVNDVLAKTASKTNTDVIQLGWAFAELGNTGRMAGLEIEELSAFMGVLANNGVRGTNAGTTLKNSMIALLSPTKKANELMKSLGIDMANYVDETGKFKKGGLIAAFDQLNQAYTQGRVGIGTLTQAFGKLPAKGIATFASTGRAELERLTNTFYDAAGTAEKAANIAFKGLDGAIKQFESRIDVSAVRLIRDSGLKLVFEDIVRILSDVLPPIIDLLAVAFKPIAVMLKILIAPFRIIGALLGGIIKLTANFSGSIMDGILTPFYYIVDLFDKLVELAGQFGAALANVKSGPLSGIFKFVEDIVSIFTNLVDILVSLFRLLGSMLYDVFGDLLNSIMPFIDAIIKPLKEFFGFIGDLIADVAKILNIEAESLRTISGRTEGEGGTTKTNTFNINAPVNVTGGGAGGLSTANAVRGAVISQFSIELQKVVIESGGL